MGTFKSLNRSYRTSESGTPDPPTIAEDDNRNQDPLCDEFGRVWARAWPVAPLPPNPVPIATAWITNGQLSELFQDPQYDYALIVNAWHEEGSTVWLQVFNQVAEPVNGDRPVFSWPMPPAPALSSFDTGGFPYKANDGLWLVFSSTGPVLTRGVDGWINALVGKEV